MLHALVGESENKAQGGVLSTPAKNPSPSFDLDARAHSEPEPLARLRMPFGAHSAYGNQAALKGLPEFMPSLSNQSRLQMLQRKSDCACGSQCAECKGKNEARANYIEDVEDIDDGIPKQVADTATTATPMKDEGDAKKTTPSCTDICDRAYKDASLNFGGGGVVCDGVTKCPCVFDVPPLKRGQCPEFDKNVLTHEKGHLEDVDCDSEKSLHRPHFRDQSKANASECKHRKESIKGLNRIIPRAKGDCKTGMETIRAGLEKLVKTNCT